MVHHRLRHLVTSAAPNLSSMRNADVPAAWHLGRASMAQRKHEPGPPMTLGNMQQLSMQAKFEKGNDHQSKYQQHSQFEPKQS